MKNKIDRDKFKKKCDFMYNVVSNGGAIKNAYTDSLKHLYDSVYLANDQVKMRDINAEWNLMFKEVPLAQVVQQLKDNNLWEINE